MISSPAVFYIHKAIWPLLAKIFFSKIISQMIQSFLLAEISIDIQSSFGNVFLTLSKYIDLYNEQTFKYSLVTNYEVVINH